MKRRNLILIIMAVILIVAAGAGAWYVSRPKTTLMTTNTVAQTPTTDRQACQLTANNAQLNGKTYTSPGDTFSFCVPSGWSLNEINGFNSEQGAIRAARVTYDAAANDITVRQTGGSDSQSTFAVTLNTDKQSSLNGYNKSDTVTAGSTTGQIYTKTADGSAEGVAATEAGTKQYVYRFVSGKRTVDISYNQFPSQPDLSATTLAIAKSLRFN